MFCTFRKRDTWTVVFERNASFIKCMYICTYVRMYARSMLVKTYIPLALRRRSTCLQYLLASAESKRKNGSEISNATPINVCMYVQYVCMYVWKIKHTSTVLLKWYISTTMYLLRKMILPASPCKITHCTYVCMYDSMYCMYVCISIRHFNVRLLPYALVEDSKNSVVLTWGDR